MHLNQACATLPHWLDNLHFAHFDKYVNLRLWLMHLSKCAKWRLSNQWGGVAHACSQTKIWENGTASRACVFDGFGEDVSTRFER